VAPESYLPALAPAPNLLAGCAALFALIACAAPAPEQPAVLVAPDAQTRAELLQAVRSSLNGAPVTLADDALTKESALIIERTPPRDATGRLLDGRGTGRPEHFHLVGSGSSCTLVHDGTGRRIVLANATCKAAR